VAIEGALMWIKLPTTIAALSLMVLISLATAAQNDGDAPKPPPKPRHVFTNDDLNGGASPYQTPSQTGDGLPPIPGLTRCGKDLKCFVQALDQATPAAVTRTETAEQGNAIVTSTSTWWTTQFTGDRCTVSIRLDALEAKVNEKVVPPTPKPARDAAEDRLAELKRDFETIRGTTSSCSLAVKDFKALMTSSSWSLMSVGPASNFGKNCSGPAFAPLHGAPGGRK